MGLGKLQAQFNLKRYDVGGKDATKGDFRLTGEEINLARADGWNIKVGGVFTMAMGTPDRLSNEIVIPYEPMVTGEAAKIKNERAEQLNAKNFADYQKVLSQLKKMNLSEDDIRQILREVSKSTDSYDDNGEIDYLKVDFSKIKINRLLNTVTITDKSAGTTFTSEYKYNNGKKVSTERTEVADDNTTTKTVYKFHYTPIKSCDPYQGEPVYRDDGLWDPSKGSIVKEWTEEIVYKNGKKETVNNFVGIGDEVLSWGSWNSKASYLISGKTYNDKGQVIDSYPRKSNDGKMIHGDDERFDYFCTKPVQRYDKTIKKVIGNVSFYASEVLKDSTRIDTERAHNHRLIHVVETPFGTFEYRDEAYGHHPDSSSILSGNVTNVGCLTYKGTDKSDTLNLKNSGIIRVDITDNNKDVIYLDKESTFGLFEDSDFLEKDSNDKIIRRK